MSNKKHLCIFVPTLGFGGGERVAVNLANCIGSSGLYKVTLLLYTNAIIDYDIDKSINVVSIDEPVGLYVFPQKVIHFVKKIIKVNRFMRNSRVDAIFCIMHNCGIIGLLAKTRGIKLLISEQTIIQNEVSRLSVKAFYGRADYLVAASEGVRDDLVNLNKKLQVNVIYNPINIVEVVELSKLPIVNKVTSNYILGAGRLVPQKGFDLLIEAYSLCASKDTIDLVIMGEGPEKESLTALVHTLNLSGKVHFVSFQKNLYNWMRQSRCFVFSSRFEGFGIILAEALACNANIVSFDCRSGPRQILEDGKFGVLVEPENYQKLSNCIDEVLNHPPEIFESLRINRAMMFDTRNIANQYLEVIEYEKI